MRKLHLGAGANNLSGWINIDIDSPSADLRMDLRQKLPYPDNTVDLIFAEHFIEHISKDEGLALFKECSRVLKPNGILRLSTPDLEHLTLSYLTREINTWGELWQPPNPCDFLNQAFRFWGHQYLYDWETLHDILQKSGFGASRRVQWRQSSVAMLQDLESRPFHRELIVEAYKASANEFFSPGGLSKNKNRLEGSVESIIRRRCRSLELECRTKGEAIVELEKAVQLGLLNETYIADLRNHISRLEEEVRAKGRYIAHIEEMMTKENKLESRAEATNYLVSVILITYNHEKYIEKALDGLFSQSISGPMEIIVADDCSTDGTVSRIRNRAKAHKDIDFIFLESERNLGITRNYQRAFAACRGRYVSILEGDDYWISRDKLALQVAHLEQRLESDLCSSNYYVYDEERAHFSLRCPAGSETKTIGARELIHDNIIGNFSTCVYRRSALTSLPAPLFEIESYDWIVNIWIARTSLISFIAQPLSVYRVHSGGAWSKSTHLGKLRLQLSLIPSYDQLCNMVFHDDFENLATQLQRSIAVLEMEEVVHEEPIIIQRSFPALVRLAMSPKLASLRPLIPNRIKKIVRRKITRRA